MHDDESSDGRVQSRLARWNKKLQPVKKEPIELSPEDSHGVGEMCQGVIVEGQPKFVNRPWIPFSANIIAPARACPELRGFISRELAMLESVPGWHILPNGIMAHSNPNAMHFHDPRSAFGDEWTSRMTLIKDRKGSQWQQVESLVDYRSSPAPFQLLPQGPRKILTFIATNRIRDYFGPDCEVPVSQYPLLDGEPPSWPEDEEVDREGGEIPTLAAESGEQPEVREEVLFADPQEIEVQIDEEVVTMANTLKKLQEKCNMLGLATSGSKAKLLARLQKYKHREEERIASESAKRLYAESRREAIPIKTPKLPTRHEQELHLLTHLPYQDWCMQCVMNRAREDARPNEARGDRRDRGKQVISFDYGFTFTEGAGEERQLGTALYAADSETKAVMCIPVVAKGSASLSRVTEELLRFTMSVANANPVILQADGEPATKQVMRAVQHARAALGMATEIRATGAGQHASNGQAEKTVQSVRKLANTLRSFAEEKAGVKITGLHHVFPWSFRHAAWLMTRYRVINGATSFEVMNDRKYNGKVVIFGEAVLFKDTMRAKWKGEPVYRRGIWVGKSSWSDSHILLTRSGAVEARSIRRLPEQFDGNLLIAARGVPWQYSVQGLLMRSKFAARTRKADAEEEAEGNEEVLEEEAKKTGEGVAMGLYGMNPGYITPVPMQGSQTPVPPTPGGVPAPKTPRGTPGIPAPKTPVPTSGIPAPKTPVPAPRTPVPASRTPGVAPSAAPGTPSAVAPVPKSKSTAKQTMLPFMKDARKESPRVSVEESPSKMRRTEKDTIWKWAGGEREGAFSSGSQIKRPAVIQILDEVDEPSPKRLRSIHDTHPGGDSLLAEELLQAELNVDSDEEIQDQSGKERPPDMTEDELAKLDDEATKHEEERLMKMGVLERLDPDDPDEPGSYTLTTKMVVTWKNREEQGGWFRRARLVARQYKWSVFTDDAFAPTSASVIVRLMLQFMLMTGLSLYVLDVKDAFLLMEQPEDEKAIVMTPHGKYRLRRNLPGQRNAAAQWFHGFCRAAKEYGLVMDKMQPTLMKKDTNVVGERLLLTIHVDDLMVIGDPEEVASFIKFLESKNYENLTATDWGWTKHLFFHFVFVFTIIFFMPICVFFHVNVCFRLHHHFFYTPTGAFSCVIAFIVCVP